jgi:hypothetical protein
MARSLWLQFAGAIYLSNIVVLEDPGVDSSSLMYAGSDL